MINLSRTIASQFCLGALLFKDQATAWRGGGPCGGTVVAIKLTYIGQAVNGFYPKSDAFTRCPDAVYTRRGFTLGRRNSYLIMSDQNALAVRGMKIYVPARDFEESKRFYAEMGFTLTEAIGWS